MEGPVLRAVNSNFIVKIAIVIIVTFGSLSLSGCNRSAPRYEPWQIQVTQNTPTPESVSTLPTGLTGGGAGAEIVASATPNVAKILPTLRAEAITYIVQANDTLAKIALKFQVSVNQIIAENQLENPNLIEVGQELVIPPATANVEGSDYKIIPDSELVYGPSAVGFSIENVVSQMQGYLLTYAEEIDGETFSGVQIVQRVADENSVNPRLLLALLEYQSQWLTNPKPDEKDQQYPMGFPSLYRDGLYKQLSWAANELNRGYYLWQANQLAVWTLADGSVVRINPTINNGTAGLQYLLGLLNGKPAWDVAVSEAGFQRLFLQLYGNPFVNATEQPLPDSLSQPVLVLPFEPGAAWYFTSGPHGGWNDGSPWAALDFAPPGEPMGCMISYQPVLAIASGTVVRTGIGAVVVDLDGDGYEQTGWTIHYMHIDANGRVTEGTSLAVGDLIGYTSCEGGFSSGTHLHIARRYNGIWISAYGDSPFVMDGWTPSSTGIEYDGFLEKEGIVVEAWNGQSTINQISR